MREHSDSRSDGRALGAMEKLFWLLDQNRPTHFALVGECLGAIDEDSWQDAIDRVLGRSRLVWSRIVESSPGEPRFVANEAGTIPVTYSQGNPEAWEKAVEAMLRRPFDASRPPLFRAGVISDGQKSTLILCAHHSVCDGLGMVELVRKVVEATSKAGTPHSDMGNCVEQIAASSFGASLPVAQPNPPSDTHYRPYRPGGQKSVTVRRALWSKAFVEQLRARARSEATTVHSALCAGFAQAFRELSTERNGASVDARVFTPIDVRSRLLFGSRDLGLAVTGATFDGYVHEPDFWTRARAIETQCRPFKSVEGLAAILGTTQALMSSVVEADQAAGFFAANLGNDVMISNLGALDVANNSEGPVTLERIWGPAVTIGFESEQAIGVSSVDGSMGLVHTSFAPLPGLIDTAQDLIGNAIER